MGGRALAANIAGIIRRNLRNASMTGHLRRVEPARDAGTALKASRKPIKLQGLARRRRAQRGPTLSPTLSSTASIRLGSTRLGYVIDDGPRNEAPGDAGCGVVRRGADRPDRRRPGCSTGTPCARRSRRRSAPSPGSISSSTGAIDVSVFPGSYVSFHDVGLKGGGDADPALAGRRADRESAAAAAAAAAFRDRRRHDAAPAHPRRPRRPMARATGRRSSRPSRAP